MTKLLQDPIEQARLKRLNLSVGGMFLAVPLVAGLIGGLDWGKAALVGCLVVGINLLISQRLAAKLIFDQAGKALALMVYLFKLGLSVLILYLAVVRFHLNLWGVMLGLSSVILAILISSLGLNPKQDQPNDNQHHV